MKTSSRNIKKLRVALQNMNSAEFIISTISNGCLETLLKNAIDDAIRISEAVTKN